MLMSVEDLRHVSFFNMKYLVGNGLILVGCFGSAFYNAYCKGLMKRFQEIEILIFSYITASLASIPLLIWAEPFHWSVFGTFDWKSWAGFCVPGDFHVRGVDAVFLCGARTPGCDCGVGFALLVPIFGVLMAAVFWENA